MGKLSKASEAKSAKKRKREESEREETDEEAEGVSEGGEEEEEMSEGDDAPEEEEGEMDDEDEPEEGNDEETEEKEQIAKKKKGKLLLKTDKPGVDPEEKQRKSGVLYFSCIPPRYTVSRMKRELGALGAIGRLFLQPEKRRTKSGKARKAYSEGWVEFASKSEAKRIALSINNTPVCAGRRSAASDTLWNCRYLSGFKWIHLVEQLAYENKLEQARMRSEIGQARRVAEHFAEQIEKGKHLKRLEEKVLKKKGVWNAYERQISQRKAISAKKSAARERKAQGIKGPADDELMKMIFADD